MIIISRESKTAQRSASLQQYSFSSLSKQHHFYGLQLQGRFQLGSDVTKILDLPIVPEKTRTEMIEITLRQITTCQVGEPHFWQTAHHVIIIIAYEEEAAASLQFKKLLLRLISWCSRY